MKRVFLLLLVAVLTSGAALAEPAAEGAKTLPARTFQVKYKPVDRAAALIKPLLSAEGSVSMQASTSALIVTDRTANLSAIAAALSEFDTAPRQLKLSIRLVMAGKAAGARTPEEVRDLAPKLAMIGFNSVESLGQAEIEGREGEPAAIEMANGYRADFHFGDYDPTSKTVSVNDLKLSRLDPADKTQPAKDLYKTTLNLKVGQTYIFATTKKGEKALVIVLAARK